MTTSRQPVTLLHAIVQRSNLSWDEAAQRTVDALKDNEGASVSLTGRHLARIAKLERPDQRPTPIIRRALQYAFQQSVDQLLLPCHKSVRIAPEFPPEPTRSAQNMEVLSMAAERARSFRSTEMTSHEAIDALRADVQALALAYPTRPLDEFLPDLVRGQDSVFDLLERPQRPSQCADLYFLAGLLSGMLAKASHDQGNATAAFSQARTAWLCAEHSGDDGLRAWVCGLQSLVSYWAHQPGESVKYAQRGTEYASRVRNSSLAWLPASEARAWAKLGNTEQARAALERAEEAWPSVQPDTLDSLGGIASFSEARQVYFAAEALSWLPGDTRAMATASRAVARYDNPSDPDYAFGDAAGSHACLAIARIRSGDEDGAADAVRSVLDLPASQRINGIVAAVDRVHEALSRRPSVGTVGRDLQEEIEAYARASLPRLPRG